MADTPAISVVIPVYEGAAFVADAVASVRAQTVSVSEIIVVDDGSTDATAEVVRAQGEGVRYLHQENRGPAAARNRGVAAAGGDWIAFLDADDRWPQGKLAAQLEHLRKHPDVVLVSGDMSEVDDDGKVRVESALARHGQLERFRALNGRHIPAAVRELLAANFIPTGTVLVRRHVLVEVGGFNPYLRYGEDLELWCRIAARYPIACVPQVLMWRRRHATNLSGRELPLLRELARVGEVIRGWGRGVLEVQGVDLDRWAAERHTDLGYALFVRDRPAEARAALWRALHTKVNRRAGRYLVLSCLPRPVLAVLRRVTGRRSTALRGRVLSGGARPKRVLLVENGIGYGGAVICLRHLVRNLDRRRFAPLVVTGRRGGPYEALAQDGPWHPIRDRRIDVVAWKARLQDATWPDRMPGLRWVAQQLLARLDDLGNFVPYFVQLLWLALRFRPDLVHANNEPLCNRAAIFVAKVLRVPVVCHVRGQRDAGGLLRWLYGLPDHYLAVSAWVRDEILTLGVDASRCEVVYDGIELAGMDTTAGGAAFRRAHGIGEDRFVIGLVGLLIPWKGHRVLIDAAPEILAATPNAHLVLAGGTPDECRPYEQELRALVQERGLAERIQFLGHVSDMSALYNALDVVLSCSTSPEPLGTVVIEAMTMGRPMIGPAHGGAAEMIEDGKSGLLTRPGDASALAAAIIRLNTDPDYARRLGVAARERALQLFAVEEHVRRVQAAYDRLTLAELTA